MADFEKSKEYLEERRQAILDELEMVHAAISRISDNGQASEVNKAWVDKLKKWHEELHQILEKFPHSQQ